MIRQYIIIIRYLNQQFSDKRCRIIFLTKLILHNQLSTNLYEIFYLIGKYREIKIRLYILNPILYSIYCWYFYCLLEVHRFAISIFLQFPHVRLIIRHTDLNLALYFSSYFMKLISYCWYYLINRLSILANFNKLKFIHFTHNCHIFL